MTTVAELLDMEGAAARRTLMARVGAVLVGTPAAVLAGPSLAAQVVDAISSLVRVPVGSLALVAWSRYRTVAAACRETAERNDARKVIALREHTMSITQNPTVELEVGGTSHRLLELTLAVTLRFTAAEAMVSGGSVREVRPGPAVGSATLSTGGIELARHTSLRCRFRRRSIWPPRARAPGWHGPASTGRPGLRDLARLPAAGHPRHGRR